MKREYVTVVFSRNTREITTAGTILMVVTGDKETTYYNDNKYWNQTFVRTKCSRFRYWLAKHFLGVYAPGLCGFNCPAEESL